MSKRTDPRWAYAHKQARKKALANFVDGTRCALCGRPMRAGQKLELDHVIPVALGGANGPTRLVHQPCNSAAGNRLVHYLHKRGIKRRPPRRRLPKW